MGIERSEDFSRSLESGLRARLDAGEHEAVAVELAAADRHAEAGWVLEQIWDFAAATHSYLAGGRLLDALRTSVEARDPTSWAAIVAALSAHRQDHALLERAAHFLQRRGRHSDAAELLALAQADPHKHAEALLRAGSPLAAAEVLAEAGLPRRALAALGPLDTRALHQDASRNGTAPAIASHPREHALAAALCWDLGDAEGTARHAQQARRAGALEGELGRSVRNLLARALASLGHDLAGQLVLAEVDDRAPEHSPAELTPQGRYRVTATLSAPYAGAAYVGVDRVSLQEVELHLLLTEFGEQAPDPGVQAAIERFASLAERANTLAHPAIRPILRLDHEVGLLVMPRREGPVLRSLIRAPGMVGQATARARALIAFMLDAIAAAHGVGLVHGSLLPSQIVCDALGRPLLGPFGAHELAGLVATRTGGLEELLTLTPPERRAGGEATQAGDIYMLGALWAALLTGYFDPPLDELPATEREELARMLAEDPDKRPLAREALARLRAPVEDLTTLAGGGPQPEDSVRETAPIDPRLGRAIEVVAVESWTDASLDLLCTARNPWLQNILDRDGRAFRLAAWPSGCRTLEAEADWESVLDPLALELLSPAGEPNTFEIGHETHEANASLREALTSRMNGASVVVTPAGEFMLALDELLTR